MCLRVALQMHVHLYVDGSAGLREFRRGTDASLTRERLFNESIADSNQRARGQWPRRGLKQVSSLH